MDNKKNITEESIKEAIKRYFIDKKGSREVAKELGVSRYILKKIFKEKGLELESTRRNYKGGKKETDRRYREENKERLSILQKKRYEKNKEILLAKQKERYNKIKNTISFIEKRRDYHREKLQTDSQYRFTQNTRSSVRCSILNNKEVGALRHLPYSIEELRKHIESQFDDKMNWDNYGSYWHLDHIVPISAFNITSYEDEDFKTCWALSNLRPLEGRENIKKGSKINEIVCFQHKVNMLKEKNESYFSFLKEKASLENSIIKLVEKKDIIKFIEEHEWMKSVPPYTKYHFGLYFIVDGKEYLGGALTFQDDYSHNLDTWKKYKFKGEILLLSRGACAWWTPKNSASFFITKAIKWIKQNTNCKVVTATVDITAGEVGIIYQSLNWNYLGLMSGNQNKKRLNAIIDGKRYTTRSLRSKFGTIKKEEILKIHSNTIFEYVERKKRYITFIGSKKEIKNNKSKIENLFKPYPSKAELTSQLVVNSTKKFKSKKPKSVEPIKYQNILLKNISEDIKNDVVNRYSQLKQGSIVIGRELNLPKHTITAILKEKGVEIFERGITRRKENLLTEEQLELVKKRVSEGLGYVLIARELGLEKPRFLESIVKRLKKEM